MITSERGFTLAEVLVAVMILSVGLLAIAASSGSVYRMLGHGKISTQVAHIASTRMEILRREADRSFPRCTGAAVTSGSDTIGTSIVESWTVSGAGPTRQVLVVITTPSGHGPANDSLVATLDCR